MGGSTLPLASAQLTTTVLLWAGKSQGPTLETLFVTPVVFSVLALSCFALVRPLTPCASACHRRRGGDESPRRRIRCPRRLSHHHLQEMPVRNPPSAGAQIPCNLPSPALERAPSVDRDRGAQRPTPSTVCLSLWPTGLTSIRLASATKFVGAHP